MDLGGSRCRRRDATITYFVPSGDESEPGDDHHGHGLADVQRFGGVEKAMMDLEKVEESADERSQ